MDRDLQAAMAVVDAGRRAPAVPGRLAPEVLHALRALIPCDDLSFNDHDATLFTTYALDELGDDGLTVLEQPVTDPDSPFWQDYASSVCGMPERTGDDRSVLLRSDFFTLREWRQQPMFVDYFARFGTLHTALLPLPTVGTRSRRLVFFRAGSVGFDERERSLMTLLRPHLVELVQRRSAGPQGLTDRQVEILRLVAQGRSNTEVGAELHLSPHTVRKHLENAFERLGVTTRAEAVARVFAA